MQHGRGYAACGRQHATVRRIVRSTRPRLPRPRIGLRRSLCRCTHRRLPSLACLPAPWAPHGAHRAGAPPPPVCAFALQGCLAGAGRPVGAAEMRPSVVLARVPQRCPPIHRSRARPHLGKRAVQRCAAGGPSRTRTRGSSSVQRSLSSRESDPAASGASARASASQACARAVALHFMRRSLQRVGDARRSAMQQCGTAVRR